MTLSHTCAGDRYVVLCHQGPAEQNCQISSVPIPPNTALGFTVCLEKQFLTRHSACLTKEGCTTFAQKKPARE